MKRSLPILLLIAWAVAGSAALAYLRCTKPITDFQTLYLAASKLLSGQRATLYNIHDYPEVLPFNRPAWQALIFVPFALLPYRAAFLAWFAVSVGLLGASFWLLRDELRTLGVRERWGLGIALAVPIENTLMVGQDSALFLLLIVLAYRALKEGREARSGILLGLASSKLHLLLPVFLLFALRRKWRLLGSVAGVGGILFLLSTFIAGGLGWIPRCLAAQEAVREIRGIGTARDLFTALGLQTLVLPSLLLGLILVMWVLRSAPAEVALTKMVFATAVLNWHSFLYDYLCVLPAWASASAQVKGANPLPGHAGETGKVMLGKDSRQPITEGEDRARRPVWG